MCARILTKSLCLELIKTTALTAVSNINKLYLVFFCAVVSFSFFDNLYLDMYAHIYAHPKGDLHLHVRT